MLLTLKVAGKSNPATVAGAIANNIREGKSIEMVAMGPQSVNQAIKAITIARSYLSDDRVELTFRPEFMHLELDGERKSAIKLVVLTHQLEERPLFAPAVVANHARTLVDSAYRQMPAGLKS